MVSPEAKPQVVRIPPPDTGSKIADITSARTNSNRGISYPLSPAVHKGVDQMRGLVRQSRIAFPPSGSDTETYIIDREFKLSESIPYLIEHGVTPQELDVLFTQRGVWRYRDKDSAGIYDLGPGELHQHMRDVLHPINSIIDRSLDGLAEDGFNRHGHEHAERVTNQGLRLLDYINADEDAQQNLIIAAQTHDIGNLFGREPHPIISERMLKSIFPGIDKNTQAYKIIRNAIILHDSENLGVITSMWSRLSSEERLEQLANYLRPEGLALLIADKVEIGRSRISSKLTGARIDRDEHAVINLLGEHEGISPEGDAFVWTIKYGENFSDEDRGNLGHLIDGLEEKVDSGLVEIDFRKWFDLTLKHYGSRIRTAAESSLALYPSRTFRLVAEDASIGERSVIEFSRDTLERDIQKFKTRLDSSRKVRIQSRR